MTITMDPKIAPDIDFEPGSMTRGPSRVKEQETTTDKGKAAHIVKTKPGENATAVVLEARVMGYEVEALCGYKWIPKQDPTKLPICQKCKEIYEEIRFMNPELNGTPEA